MSSNSDTSRHDRPVIASSPASEIDSVNASESDSVNASEIDSENASDIDSENNSVLMQFYNKLQTNDQRLLASLGESIINKLPYISGTLQLPHSFFSVFYQVARDGNAARRINFANATPDELEQLTQACEPFDEPYHKAFKMDSECFFSSLDPFRTDLIKIIRGSLLEGKKSTKNMRIETRKLNIYSKGSSFKPHVDTPQSKKMFGSLVIVFPTHHEGGALSLRHHGHDWIFDPGPTLAGGALDRPSIGYMAFLNDIEQDVAPVASGHCVTLTYCLFFDDDGGAISEKDAISEHFIPPKPPNQDGLCEAFKALVENPEFMAEGGTLAFGLRHAYPFEDDLKPIYDLLKGSDAVVYQSVRALGFEPILYMYYWDSMFTRREDEGLIIDKVIPRLDFDDGKYETVRQILLQENGGIPVCLAGGRIFQHPNYLQIPEPMAWATPMTTYNCKKTVVEIPGDHKPFFMDGDACMVVRVGKVGDRLVYPKLKEAYY